MTNEVGRPTAFTEATKKMIIECFKDNLSLTGTCKAVGISTAGWYLWKKKAEIEKDPEYIEFFKLVDFTQAMAEKKLVQEISKDNSWQAKHAILKRRYHQEWGDKQEIDMTAKATVKHDFTGLTLEEKKQLLDKIVKEEKEDE